jgi:hypothetical protein
LQQDVSRILDRRESVGLLHHLPKILLDFNGDFLLALVRNVVEVIPKPPGTC